jgi:hypothetical protein
MDLAQLRMVQWLAIIGSMAGILSLMALWESPFKLPIIIATVVLIIFGFLVEIHRDRVAIFFSGVRRLHSSFAPEMNRAIFATVRTEYCYLGVGFSTVSTTFRSWYESDRKPNVRIRLLLTDPDAIDVLEFQARYEHNLFGDGLTSEQQDILKKTICRAQDSIKLTIDLVRTLPQLASG